MDWMIILSQLFELVLIPLLGGLATFLIILIRKKGEEISAKLDDDRKKEYVQLLTETITNCVSATSQTYVDSLKAQGKFDAEAQKVAFEKTYTAVFAILTDDAKVYLVRFMVIYILILLNVLRLRLMLIRVKHLRPQALQRKIPRLLQNKSNLKKLREV